MQPIVISCGEPAGIGPEIAVAAWQALKSEIPMLWIGDPRHLHGDRSIRHSSFQDDSAGT